MANKGKFALGAAIAGAVGYVAGILTAPKSGKETRHDIADATKKGIAEVEKQLKNLHTEIDHLLEEAKKKAGELKGKVREEIDSLIENASKAKEKAREALSGSHEGESGNDELKRVVKDVEDAMKHLQTFLKNQVK